jgi:selenide,water dikinase
VVRPEGAERALVLTLDVITPIVDDPSAFGRIAAANALSDVYAMNGEPEIALSFVGVPDEIGLDVLQQILSGMTETARTAGCSIVGGHTIRDSEPKCGLSVVGSVARDAVWSHRAARAGQALVLTKAIGTGVVAQAIRRGRAEPDWVHAVVASMEALNRDARDAGRRQGATSATDVTGFGLLGHLHHLAAASGLTARIRATDVPLLPGAREAVELGLVPGGSKRNLQYVASHLEGADRLDDVLLTLLADAQTSGGLLLAIPADGASRVVSELGAPAAVIGELVAGAPGRIELS